MTDSVETTLRVASAALALLLLLYLERVLPLRPARVPRGRRRLDNLLLFVSGVVLNRLLLPLSAVGAAFLAQRHGLGLAHWVHLRLGIAFVMSLVLLDAAVYLQHRLMHRWRPLWLLHRVHHSDRELDVTSALRFHPLELLVSAVYKVSIVVALGAPPVAVLSFEILLSVSVLFNHSNLGLSPRIERWLRVLWVTPAMHWIHHSVQPQECQHNFGFCLTWWDRWSGTYQYAPRDGYRDMQLGIEGLDEVAPGVMDLLLQPARKVAEPAAGSYLPRTETLH